VNREDALDSMAYWVATKENYPEWRTQCLNKPYWHNPNPKVLGKVTAVDYTSDKDHSSACFYVKCNPEGSGWIDFLKKRIDLGERQQRISFNSHYGMYVEEKPEQSYVNYILYNKQEDKKMTQAEITYEAQKHELEQEEAAEFNQLLADQAAARHNLKTKYDQKRFDLEKLKEDAERKEKAEAHAKAVKETYDSYITQGFTKTQAEAFIKIALENLST